MKHFFSITLFSLYAMVLMMPGIQTAYYFANKEYIANQLCENRFQPKLKCEGKCFLMQKIQESYQESSPAEKEQLKVEVRNFFIAFMAVPAPISSLVLQDGEYAIYEERMHAVELVEDTAYPS